MLLLPHQAVPPTSGFHSHIRMLLLHWAAAPTGSYFDIRLPLWHHTVTLISGCHWHQFATLKSGRHSNIWPHPDIILWKKSHIHSSIRKDDNDKIDDKSNNNGDDINDNEKTHLLWPAKLFQFVYRFFTMLGAGNNCNLTTHCLEPGGVDSCGLTIIVSALEEMEVSWVEKWRHKVEERETETITFGGSKAAIRR